MRLYSASLLALLLAGAVPSAASAQRDGAQLDTTVAFDRGGSIALGAVSGEIRVTGSSRNDVRIVASIERGTFETDFSRSAISIHTRSDRNRQGRASIQVTVPVGTRVSATMVSGDIEITATEGEVTARSTSGDLTIRNARGRLELATVSGDVVVRGASGRMMVNGVSSDIEIVGAEGRLEAETVSGSIDILDSRLTDLQANALSGNVTYRGTLAANGSYRLNTHSGEVRLGLPPDVGAELTLETFSGSIHSDFPLTMQPGETGSGRRGRRLQFTLGSGGARITAGAFSGNITIRRTSATDRE